MEGGGGGGEGGLRNEGTYISEEAKNQMYLFLYWTMGL